MYSIIAQDSTGRFIEVESGLSRIEAYRLAGADKDRFPIRTKNASRYLQVLNGEIVREADTEHIAAAVELAEMEIVSTLRMLLSSIQATHRIDYIFIGKEFGEVEICLKSV